MRLSLLLPVLYCIGVCGNVSVPLGDTPHYRSYFYAGGAYADDGTGTGEHAFNDQMYVEQLTPTTGVRHPYPIVFIHGQGQTGTNWLNTPDGRAGWASWFLGQGYELYIIDQTLRARSGFQPLNDTFAIFSAEFIERFFTVPERFNLWPQAALHTQWPGTGMIGDPIFDQYYASNVPSVSVPAVQQASMRKAGAALLDRIGPAIILGHSQGGPPLWAISDARPELVKGIVAIEPSGPPFQDTIIDTKIGRPWGLTDIPITYDPPVTDPAQIQRQLVGVLADNQTACTIQAEPARQLVNLKNIPVLLETGEASFHAAYDHCNVQYLKQAGVNVEHLRLGDVGIHGNGHMQFLEKNRFEIAAVVESWIRKIQ